MFKRAGTVGTILFVGFLHLLAVRGDWYFFLWWYDVMMHTLGGVAMGLLAQTLWEALSVHEVREWRSALIHMGFVLGFVACIGIGWEWFEALVDGMLSAQKGLAPAQLGLTDTMLDLYFDMFGGLFAWLFLQSVRVGEQEK